MRCCSAKVLSVFLVASLVFLAAALVLIFKFFPDIIYDEVNKEVRLENGTEAFDRFVQIPFELEFNVYLFNINNPQEIFQGAKPNVTQVGPYVYRENRTRTITGENPEKDTLDYYQTLQFVFDENASYPLKESDVLTVFNNPLMEMFRHDIPYIDTSCLLQAFKEEHRSIFINLTVKEYLFDGFTFCESLGDGLCTIINIAACEVAEKIKFIDKNDDYSLNFSVLNYKVRENDGIFTVKRGIDDPSTLGQAVKWNNSTFSDFWGHHTECDKIRGGDSSLYPPRVSKDDSFFVYSTDICRAIEIKYAGTGTYKGIDGYYFQTDHDTFRTQYENIEDDCFCTKETPYLDGQPNCYLDGTVDVKVCMGVATVLSFPHFLEAEQYLEYIDGLKPDPSKHQTYVLLEPHTGVPLQGYKRIQLNEVLRPFGNVEQTALITPALVPTIFIEEGISLPQKYVDELNDKFFSKLSLVNWVQYGLLALSATLVLFFTVLTGLSYFRSRNQRA